MGFNSGFKGLKRLLLYESGLERVAWDHSGMDWEPEFAICFVAHLCSVI